MSDPTKPIDRPEPSEARTAAAESLLGEGQTPGGRYRVQKLLGRGGMGEVWQAFDLKLRVEVALKTIHAHLFPGEQGLEMLRREVLAARAVVSPNVCRIFDLVEVDGQELVSMEYVDGTTLLDLLQERGGFEIEEAAEIASQFLAGLEAIHGAGLVHRDLKPENLMVTRSGRVLVMDFGIAKDAAGQATGTVSGTPAYMAPEQARGDSVDARTDVFAAGVVLAELMSGDTASDSSSRQTIWKKVHHDPPQAPEGPWSQVITKAVAKDPDDRYESAGALARALEEATLRTAGADEATPYPGLSAFTESEAEYFFGREAEVEALWKKLTTPRLQALIGPSGAGKSSFVRAGLLPAMASGWRAIVCHPGDRPMVAMARALTPELAGDTEAQQELVRFEEPDVAVELFAGWRAKHEQVLVILDQFEELFTLIAPEAQTSVADLLGRLPLEADVHVLLSMRDDFFLHCNRQPSLAPVFSDTTPLDPLTGAALRRALVQPALKCGYRFEDEALVDEMLAEVETERGALPLLAFAAASLWERRDRQQGLLTREAYEAIGGVAGALAQYAEQTLETVGQENAPVVRELFRNLVTSQGTRVSRTREELLSVFEGGTNAGTVLDTLIDARLLTSYELPGEGQQEGGRRIEIIHESLLSNWPRLVRWQTQDADGAQLRDQLRQAAQLWQERGCPSELLWTGTPLREFLVWRENYVGGLTATEEAFASAMVEQAERRRKTRRIAIAAAFAVLLAIMAAFGVLWRGSEAARREATMQAARAEASKLLVLGRLEREVDPSASLAYALASLERFDTSDARKLALEALSEGPVATFLRGTSSGLDFSPDGSQLARGVGADFEILPRDGGPPRRLPGHEGMICWAQFSPDGDHLVTSGFDNTVRVWSVPEGELEATLQDEGPAAAALDPTGNEVRMATLLFDQRRWRLGVWPLGGAVRVLADFTHPFESGGDVRAMVDRSGRRVVFGQGKEVRIVPFEEPANGYLIGRHGREVRRVAFSPDGDRIVSADVAGELRIWSSDGSSGEPLRVLPGQRWQLEGEMFFPAFSHDGRWLATPLRSSTLLWDLEAPPGIDPVVLRDGAINQWNHITTRFDPMGRWLAVGEIGGLSLWSLDVPTPRVIRAHPSSVDDLVFAPDGSSLFSTGAGELREWPMSPGREPRQLRTPPLKSPIELDVSPDGESLIVGDWFGLVFVIPLDGSAPRELEGMTAGHGVAAVKSSPSGRLVAAASGSVARFAGGIHLWDLDTDEATTLDAGDGVPLRSLAFVDEHRLLSAGFTAGRSESESAAEVEAGATSEGGALRGALRMWDLATGESKVLLPEPISKIDFSAAEDLVVGLRGRAGFPEGIVGVRLSDGRVESIRSHGAGTGDAVAFDPTGSSLIVGSAGGEIHAGAIDAGPPHLLLGHDSRIRSLAIDPAGRWIASGDVEGTIRLWPMPQGRPFHTLPYEELLTKLRALTNYRVVPDEESDTGYTLEIGPFPGWETVPSW